MPWQKLLIEYVPTILKLIRWRKICLIIDDDQNDARHLETLLTRADVKVDVVASANEAFAILEHQKYNAMFIDMRLPGMKGWDLIKAITDWNPSARIIIVTGQPLDLGHIEPGVLFSCIIKPVTAESIRKLLKERL